MTAASLQRSSHRSGLSGPRPVNPRRDMAPLADLIEVSFGGRLDAGGRRLVNEMRAFGQAGWPGWLLGRLFLPPAAYPLGYVWEQDGKIVGNASLLPVESGSRRWVMANVAVHPAYRRRGIARRLVRAGISLVRRRGGAEIVLQVDHENHGAQRLYHQLRFEVLTTRTSWSRGGGVNPPTLAGPRAVAERRDSEWVQQWKLAQRLFPEGIAWPYPLNEEWFRPSGWLSALGWKRREHGVIRDERGRVEASGTARFSRQVRGWRLALLVPESSRGELEGPLLRWLIGRTSASGLSVSLSYPTGPADAVIEELNFRARRTLTWMGLSLAPGDGAA